MITPVAVVGKVKLRSSLPVILKGEGNFQNNLPGFNTGPPLLLKYIGEKAHNALKVKLLAFK